jgi:hypothetical protein
MVPRLRQALDHTKSVGTSAHALTLTDDTHGAKPKSARVDRTLAVN